MNNSCDTLMAKNRKIKVLFIAGNGRSGSTILNIILGQLAGLFAVGELRRIWDRGLIENRPCGCGIPFRECPTWISIFKEAFGAMENINPSEMAKYRDRYTQTKHLPGLLMGKHSGNRISHDVRDYLDALDALYKAIKKVTACDIIVDSSKWPMYAYMLDLLPSIELYVIHLVRDPRGFSYSFTRKKEYEPGKLHLQMGPFRSSGYWFAWNPAIEHFWKRPDTKYMRVNYEYFVEKPQDTIFKIVQFIEGSDRDLPFIDEKTVELEKTHAVAGNIARLTRGPVELKLDDEWKTQMPIIDKLLVSMLTFPLLFKYGYFVSRNSL